MSQKLPDSVWLEIFSYLPHRKRVLLSSVSRNWRRILSDQIFWKRISIDDFNIYKDNVTDEWAKRYVGYGKRIEYLSLIECSQISNKVLINLSFNASRLTDLNLQGCLRITDRGLNTLAKSCSTLRQVNVMGTLISSWSLRNLLTQNQYMLDLTANSSTVSEDVIHCLAEHCKNLEVLHAEEGKYDPLYKNQFKRKRNKTVLTAEMICVLAFHCRNLNVLIMRYDVSYVNNSVLVLLGYQCQRLECIELDLIDQSCVITDEGLGHLCLYLSNLTHLHILDTKVTDATLFIIASNCMDMRYLDLGKCEGISDLGVVNLLRHCRELESLSLGNGMNCRLTNLSVMALAQSKCAEKLIRLSIAYWNIGDVELYILSGTMANLMHLSIQGCSRVTFTGLHNALKLWENLSELNISFTKCVSSDAELFSLTGVSPKLKRIILYGCNGISVSAVRLLQFEQPSCVVESEM